MVFKGTFNLIYERKEENHKYLGAYLRVFELLLKLQRKYEKISEFNNFQCAWKTIQVGKANVMDLCMKSRKWEE